MFLEEDDHQCEGGVASSRIGFEELSDGRENQGYKGNTRMFLEGSSIKKKILISHLLEGN